MNEVAWNAIAKDESRRLPTAPISYGDIQWFEYGDKAFPFAAKVVGVEGAGRLKLVIFKPNALPQHKTAVYHVNSPIHDQTNNPTTYRCGSWDYIPGVKIPKEHYELFDEDIERRKENLRKAEEAAVKNAELFAKKQAERFAGKVKPPEPIPSH